MAAQLQLELTIQDLQEVRQLLNSVRRKWYDIGVELKFKVSELKTIKSTSQDDPLRCLTEMLEMWLKSIDPLPTWEALEKVLRSEVIKESSLANQAHLKHCSDGQCKVRAAAVTTTSHNMCSASPPSHASDRSQLGHSNCVLLQTDFPNETLLAEQDSHNRNEGPCDAGTMTSGDPVDEEPIHLDSASNITLNSDNSLDSDTIEDLTQQLEQNFVEIQSHYASFVRYIRLSVEAKGISVEELCSFLLNLPAFECRDGQRAQIMLLSMVKEKLEKAKNMIDVFNLLSTEYASFINYEIFESIIKEYKITDDGEGKLNYRERLEDYVNKHRLSEFIKINPKLETFSDASKELVLKLDISLTFRMSIMVKLKSAVARILGLRTAALRLLSIKEGCVVMTFLIPMFVADAIFTGNVGFNFSVEQVKMFQALSVMWLMYDDFRCSFQTSECVQPQAVQPKIVHASELNPMTLQPHSRAKEHKSSILFTKDMQLEEVQDLEFSKQQKEMLLNKLFQVPPCQKRLLDGRRSYSAPDISHSTPNSPEYSVTPLSAPMSTETLESYHRISPMSHPARQAKGPNPSKGRVRRGNPNRSEHLYVSNKGNSALPEDVDLLLLREAFHQFEVVKAVILPSPTLQRVGRVTFKSIPTAAEALKQLNGHKLSDTCTLVIRYWREKDNLKQPVALPLRETPVGVAEPESSEDDDTNEDWTSRTLYIKIFDCKRPDVDITDGDLESHFQDFEVKGLQRANIKYMPGSNKPMGYAFATFKTTKAAARAIECLQDTKLNGIHRLQLSFKIKKSSGPPEAPKQNVVPLPPIPQPKVPQPLQAEIVSKPKLRHLISTLKVKDDVVGMMLMEDTTLKVLASTEHVHLSPFQYGYVIKGEAKACQVVSKQFDQCRLAIERNQVGYAQLVLSAPYKNVYSSNDVVTCLESLKKDLKVVATASLERTVVGSACLQAGQGHVALIQIVVGNLNSEKVDAVVIPTGRAQSPRHYSAALDSTFRYLYNIYNDGEELCEIGDTASLDGGSFSCSYRIQTLLPLIEQTSPSRLGCDASVANCLSLASRMRLGSVAFPGMHPDMVSSLMDALSSMGPTSLHTVRVVLETDTKAGAFSQALSSLVSSNKGSEAALKSEGAVALDPSSSNAVPSAPNSGFVWSWRDNDGLFKPYSLSAMDQLNKNYKNNHNAICFLNINGIDYQVDFKLMKQVNLITKYERDVTKDPYQTASGIVRWNYRDDFNRFMSYSPSDSAQIEAMFQANDTSRHLVILKRTYRFDFARMKQVNMATGYERDIQRQLPGSDEEVRSKSSAVRATHKRYSFLCQSEVVVNLKGPSQSVELAKEKLHNKLKSLLFSKATLCPPKATPVLLTKLKEVVNKHSVTFTVESSESDVGKRIKLEGLESAVVKAMSEIQELIISFSVGLDQLSKSSAGNISHYPDKWNLMAAEDQVKIIPLKVHSREYTRVCSKFQKTFNKQIIGVQRVQNKWLWDRYLTAKQRLHKKNAGMVNEKDLFHGTRDKPAETICRSEEGFDMRFSRQGMWGQANYFAVNASYSDTYSYHNSSSETNEMILAKVLTGDSFKSPPDSTLRMPPEKHQTVSGDAQVQQIRYDSVTGDTQGSQVFMTYSNDLAYPAYIITYTRQLLSVPSLNAFGPPSAYHASPRIRAAPVQSPPKPSPQASNTKDNTCTIS